MSYHCVTSLSVLSILAPGKMKWMCFFVLMRKLDHLHFKSCWIRQSSVALLYREGNYIQHKIEFKSEEVILSTRSLSGIGRTFIHLCNSCFALIRFAVGAWTYPGGHRTGGRNTRWTDCQLISQAPFTHTLIPVGLLRLLSQPNVHGNGLWEGAGVPGESPRRQKENMKVRNVE